MEQYSETHHSSLYRLSFPNFLGARDQRFVEIENLADVFLDLGAVERVEIELRFGRVNVSDVSSGVAD